jgi:hypothetical protein
VLKMLPIKINNLIIVLIFFSSINMQLKMNSKLLFVLAATVFVQVGDVYIVHAW